MGKHCMIQGGSHSSKEYKVLPAFGKKWSASRTVKYHKRGKINTEKANSIMSEAVDFITNHKNKNNKRKDINSETEAFCDPGIVDSDSEPEL